MCSLDRLPLKTPAHHEVRLRTSHHRFRNVGFGGESKNRKRQGVGSQGSDFDENPISGQVFRTGCASASPRDEKTPVTRTWDDTHKSSNVSSLTCVATKVPPIQRGRPSDRRSPRSASKTRWQCKSRHRMCPGSRYMIYKLELRVGIMKTTRARLFVEFTCVVDTRKSRIYVCMYIYPFHLADG